MGQLQDQLIYRLMLAVTTLETRFGLKSSNEVSALPRMQSMEQHRHGCVLLSAGNVLPGHEDAAQRKPRSR
jgi:hypothetical protein